MSDLLDRNRRAADPGRRPGLDRRRLRRPIGAGCVRRLGRGIARLAGLVSIVATLSLAQARPPDSEIYALESIGITLNAYATTGSNVWYNHHGWTANTPPDDPCANFWFGVSCDGGGNHIIGLTLTGNNVHGVLADGSVWASLPQLTTISLNNNFISGSIPDLSGLPNLQIFSVYGDTQVTGQFPAYLSGSIPSLSGLTQLQIFQVGDNHLTGSIPDLSALTNLVRFDVGGNQLTGSFPDISHNTRLDTLVLDHNQLTGSIPPLAPLTDLLDFEAASNQFTGSIPPIASLQHLYRFHVGDNQLSGPMPDIHDMAALTDVDFSYNQLSGPIECLGVAAPCSSGLSQLAAIDVSHNQLGGAFPSLDGLANLQFFAVGYNRITGLIKPMPSNFQQMISQVCPNPMNLTPQPGIDDYWPSTIPGNPTPWWGPAGAVGSCDLIFRDGFDD